MPLPILNLPSPVFQKLLGFINPLELFDLSLLSSRLRKLIKSQTLQRTCLSITWGSSVFISLSTKRYYEYKWIFYDFRHVLRSQLGDHENRMINGEVVPFYADNYDKTYQLSCGESVSDQKILKILNYIIDLFDLSEIEFLKVKVDELKSPLVIFQSNLRICKILCLSPGKLSLDEMKRFLDWFEVKEKLTTRCEVGFGLDCDKVISTNAFEAFNAYWINRQILLNLNCETVDITESQLTSQDFNAFLYQWMASDNKKIKNVRVKGGLGLRFGFKSLDMPTILHGLPFVQGSPKRQFSSSFPFDWGVHRMEYEEGMDLRRSDGKLATIMVINDYPCTFLFITWPTLNR